MEEKANKCLMVVWTEYATRSYNCSEPLPQEGSLIRLADLLDKVQDDALLAWSNWSIAHIAFTVYQVAMSSVLWP